MKLKAFLISVVVCIMLFTGCAPTSGGEGAPEGMKLFSNENVDYTAYVPMAWTVDMSTNVISAYVGYTDITSVNIITDEKSQLSTLTEYWDSYKKEFEDTFSDMEYVGKAPVTTTLSGSAAHKYTYTATVTGNKYKFMQVVCIEGGKAYVITFTSTEELFDEHIEDFDKILQNFSFND